MNPFTEKIFLIEIISQIAGAKRALERLRQATKEKGDAEAAYDHVADFLNHAAVVSKILDPPRSKNKSRGQYLQRILHVVMSEPALNRALRDHLEHIDERLEDWTAANTSGIYIDKGLIQISVLGAEDEEPIRNLDLSTGRYRFIGQDFDLAEIDASLDRIFRAATERCRAVEVPLLGRDPLKE
jgi:hypothetical protein